MAGKTAGCHVQRRGRKDVGAAGMSPPFTAENRVTPFTGVRHEDSHGREPTRRAARRFVESGAPKFEADSRQARL